MAAQNVARDRELLLSTQQESGFEKQTIAIGQRQNIVTWKTITSEILDLTCVALVKACDSPNQIQLPYFMGNQQRSKARTR